MPLLAAPLDFAKLEAKNIQIHQLTSAPGSPVPGQMYFNTVSHTLFWYDDSIPGFVTARGGGAPSAHATTHQPGGSDPMAVDAAVGTGSLRTLGSGAAQACPGNDARLSDSRAPTGAAGGDLTGSTYPNPVVAALAITDAKVATANKDGAAGTFCMRTLGNGAGKAMAGTTTLDAIPTPVLPVSLAGQRITAVADPTAPQDAATKNYVDTFTQGLDSHASVHASTTGNLTASYAANVLTNTPNTLDGVTLAANDRVLVKDQTTALQNGIYVVTTLGTGANGVWTRASDQDTWAEVPSAYVWVEMGTLYADTGWTCTSDPGGVLGTNPITWVLFSSATGVIAGNGLVKGGNTIDAVGTTNRIRVNVDNIDIDTAYAGQTSITVLGTITQGTWDTPSGATVIAVNSGGTGQTTQKTARETGLAAAGYFTTATHGAGATIIFTQANHGLRASAGLFVQCQLVSTGAVILPDVVIDGTGQVTITFAVSQSANTIRTTIIG